MNENKWDIDDVIYLIQFALFYVTVVGGIVLIVLAAIKKLSFPLLGVILVYVVMVIIQVAFLIIFSKPMPDDYAATPKDSAPTTSDDEEIKRELAEIKEMKERLRRDPEVHNSL